MPLRERRKTLPKAGSPQEGMYLKYFEKDDGPLDPLEKSKNKRLRNALNRSNVKNDGSLSKKFLASLKEKNLSMASQNKSILSAA